MTIVQIFPHEKSVWSQFTNMTESRIYNNTCDCSNIQTMSHIVDCCPLTKLDVVWSTTSTHLQTRLQSTGWRHMAPSRHIQHHLMNRRVNDDWPVRCLHPWSSSLSTATSTEGRIDGHTQDPSDSATDSQKNGNQINESANILRNIR